MQSTMRLILPEINILSTKPNLWAGKLVVAIYHSEMKLIILVTMLLARLDFNMMVFMYQLIETALVVVMAILGRLAFNQILAVRKSLAVVLPITKLLTRTYIFLGLRYLRLLVSRIPLLM